jgi:uncharacterized membrane protein HdeD (DUF308 family)
MPIVFVSGVQSVSFPWWMLLVRGIAALVFAAVTFFSPGTSLTVVVLLFGIYALLDGLLSLVAGARMARGDGGRWPLWLIGVTGVLAGVFTFVYPEITAIALVYLVAVWAIWSGVFHIMSAIRLRKYITGEWLIGLTGALQVLFGGLLIARPGIGALVLLLWLGAFAFLMGVLFLIAAFRLRGLQQRAQGGSGVLRHA